MTKATDPSRRTFIKSSAVAMGFLGLQACVRTGATSRPASTAQPAIGKEAQAVGFGPLLPDPESKIKLPKGFSYKVFSQTGEIMDDGLAVPGAHDGMAAFTGPDGHTLLVRNHELSPGQEQNGPYAKDASKWDSMDKAKVYDAAHGQPLCNGGTTTLLYDTKNQKLLQHSCSLVGSLRNCSGGFTPWGSWITCEETVVRADESLEEDHGYNFEVPATAEIGLADPAPLKDMGRFNHEAVSVDPSSGIVYQTEDRGDGLIYRYIPKVKGDLAAGGKLQALAIKGQASADTRNWEENEAPFPIGQRMAVEWIDLEDIQSPEDDLRHRGFEAGAAVFARGEGMFYGNQEIYFACTNGGAKRFGQIFRYRPSRFEGTPAEASEPGELELFVESHDLELMKACDNLTIAPWGDVVICEDDGSSSAIVGITPQGKLYMIGHVASNTELAGACFSPDGSTLFVNAQWRPGYTIAITGPWETRQA